ncbi:hypothetical protein FRC04_005687 [Tulasnella sp. 424]|nr:hypothetical protein FRC04_005687 [Tulasnella sp. 424]
MAREFGKGITADVKLSDEQYVRNEKERYVPFSVSPFQEPESQGGEETERPPEWLELAGDLAWTASFSSVTSNTTVTESIAVWNYAVFFILTWHLWATQTTYDIKYYTNDWWHRALFASQLAIYTILAALSGSFNIGWEISGDAMSPFTGNNTALTGQAIRENEVLSMKRSLIGINIVLFISRMFLLLQYLRVIWYRHQSKQLWSWRFYLPPASIFTAGCIFLGCFIMLQDTDGSKFAAVTQLTLWGLAISIQALAAAFTPEDEAEVLKSKSTLTPRLSTLTVIILGEGLNGICGTLRNNINSLGLTPRMIAEALSTLLVLYFVWLLYFDGFRIKCSSNRILEELWLWLHLPLHLSLILLLEGIKNIFIVTNVLGAVQLLLGAFGDMLDSVADTGELPEHPRLEALLLPLKMSWQQEVLDLTPTLEDDTDESVTMAVGQTARWFATCVHNIYLLFVNQQDPEAEFEFNNYLSNNDTVINDDWLGDQVLWNEFEFRYNELMLYSGHWLLAVSETVGGATSNLNQYIYWIYLIIPIIAIGYSAAAVADWIILYFSIHSIRKKEKSSLSLIAYGGVETDDDNFGRGVDVRRFSDLIYAHVPSRQTSVMEYPGSAASSQTTQRTYYGQHVVFNPYAEAGVPHYSSYHHRKQESRGSPSDSATQSLLGRDYEGRTLPS